jgi:beta-glucosidase
MVQATFHFPRGFLWGTATSSHQVEGFNTNNNWWAWEQEPGRIIHGHKSGAACDWWGGRWREDFDRAEEGGQNAHRFSIEWSRVQPLPDIWDESSLDRYREMVRGLHQRGMIPFVTLHHFSDPLWLTEKGGWENETVVDYFVPYVRKVVEALCEFVDLWVTINEPNLLAVEAYLLGNFPPGKKDLRTTFQVMTNLVRAHAAAYHAIHEIQPTARVGIAHHYRGFQPARSWSPLDRYVSGLSNRLINEFFPLALTDGVLRFPIRHKRIPQAKGTQDYLGFNYYTQALMSLAMLVSKEFFGRYPPDADLSEGGFIANVPLGMFRMLRWAKGFGLPMIIAENGVEDSKDAMRPRYLIQHLHQVWRAVNFCYPIKGYFHWSLVDNFEWERGWTQRFGLWGLDVENQARRKRPSVDLFAEICRENGISSETVARYTPELFEKLFPT